MRNDFLKKGKKGQVAETTTWIFATIIILLIILATFVVAAAINVLSGKIFGIGGTGNSKAISINSQTDLFAEKSMTAYLLTNDSSGTKVYSQIKSDRNLNSFNGNLATNLFKGLFGSYYNNLVYLGVINSDKDPVRAQFNSYFNAAIGMGSSAEGVPLAFYHVLQLNKNTAVKIVLWHTN